MHIAYEKNIVGKSSFNLGERIWHFIRFSVVTGLIFSISFFAINFNAYKSIFSSLMNPEAQAAAEDALTSSIGANVVDLMKPLNALPTKKEVRKSFSWIGMPIAPTDNRIVIPKIGKSIPIVEMSSKNLEGENWPELEKQIQGGLRKGVVHYPGTAIPGQIGNVFITGHSSYYPWDSGKFKDVFALLGQLDIGDRFYIFYNQKQYTYEISEKFEVQPSRVDVLSQPKDKRIVTLMTCTPVGTTLRRLIIRANQIS